MITIIQKQLDIVEKSINWINDSLEGNKAKDAYRNMVDYRRKLKKKKDALEGNPAAATYGESQAGKSYLVSALLSLPGESFKITDGKGKIYDFKNDINPRGNEMESTSLVTRFSTKYKIEYDEYPIIAKLLSPADLVLIICEAYYHNLNVNKSLSFNELEEKIEAFRNTYQGKSDVQNLINEDDILNIEDYFDQNFSQLVFNNIKDAKFFDLLFDIVKKIPFSEWKDVFSLLWNFNPQLTKMFDDLIQKYKELDFVETLYLPIDSVLRKKGTLLDVSRLDEIYDTFRGTENEYTPSTSVFYKDQEGREKNQVFSKPFLCALTSELIFSLPNDILEQKPFLEHTDLLDFPGTRRFENTSEDNISNESLTVLLRRGKVDYLFNKYSENERINTLLFCQNHKQSNQSVMPEKLNRWIGDMIGKTPTERGNFNSPVSPLFVISTWFNKDLEYDYNNDIPGNAQSLNARWNQRFTRTLEGEIFKTSDYDWLINWTDSNKNFQNIYLLRDFDQSSETKSHLFRGYEEQQTEIEEIKPDKYPNFREDLKKSFIDYNFVRRHFSNPEESWNESATTNKDGTGLIISNLTIAADNINPARVAKMKIELNEMSQNILALLLKYFHSNDKDDELQKAKNMAGDIQVKLAIAFAADNIKKFGHLMKDLMIDESATLNLFRKTIDNLEHRDVVNLDVYNTFRMQVPVEEGDTVEKYFERLCIRYEKTTPERKEEFRQQLEDKAIDLNELISGSSNLIKNNSQQLAEALIEYWFTYVKQENKVFIDEILNQDDALDNIVDVYNKLFNKLLIAERIAKKIRRYVDIHSKADLPYEIIADISTELLNKFVYSVGFEYLDESEITSLKLANEENNLGLILDNNISPTESSLEDLFTKVENQTIIMSQNPEEMSALPSYRNYLAWSNRLKVGFVSVCDIPNYDVAKNAILGEIINECKTINY